MATITLRKDKINGVGGLIDSIVKSSNKLDTQLGTLRNTLQGVDSSTCNLQGVVSSISSSSKSEKEKVADLKRLNSKLTDFITMTARRDADAKSAVEKSKNDFYSKYSYLKPECEKNVFEHIRDGIVTAAKWCKEHWDVINIILVALAAIAIVVASIVTFGAAAVALAAVVGVCVGVASQFIGDTISWLTTGKWTGNWESYLGSAIGGALGGVLCLTGQATIACAVDGGVSNLFSGSLSNLTGSEKSTAGEVWIKAFGGAATAAVFSKGFGKLSNNLSKNFSHIPELSRLSGKGSYGASFKMVTTKLKRGIIKNFTRKSVRNGIISELTGDIISDVVGGVNGAIDELGLLDEGKIVKKFLGYFYNNKALFAF